MRPAMPLSALFLRVCALGHAEARLPQIFGDKVVLQRGKRVAIWGWAGKGETITVTLPPASGQCV